MNDTPAMAGLGGFSDMGSMGSASLGAVGGGNVPAVPLVPMPLPSIKLSKGMGPSAAKEQIEKLNKMLLEKGKSTANKLQHIHNLLGYGPGKLVSNWDPSTRDEADTAEVLPQTMMRIKRDLKEFFVDPVPDVYLVPDDDNLCIAHAIVVGPRDTPYDGGFFYFFVKFPSEYPIKRECFLAG